MTTPTLPGHGANWLRPCSPVIVTRGTYAGLRGVVVSIADGLAMVAFDRPSISSLIALGLDDVALDLSDPTGRAHAAWWLAGAIGKTAKHGALWMAYGGDPRPAFLKPPVGWALQHDAGQEWFSRGTGWAQEVDALAHLNPDDDTLLPDGSRWVDAEALRLVCLHVAGVRS